MSPIDEQSAAVRRPHVVRLVADTPLQVDGPEGIEVRLEHPLDARVILLSRTAEEDGARLYLGIEYRIEAFAPDASAALAAARRAAEWVNNTLAAVTGAAIVLREDALVVGADPDAARHELLQIFDDVPTGRPKSRAIDVGLLARFAQALDRTAKHDGERVQRAMWHLRKSAASLDLVEAFADLWMGLESINKSLRVKHGLPTKTVVRKCPACGAPMETEASTGISLAITKLAGGTERDVRDAREFRKRLQHGSRDVMDLAPELTRLAQLLRRALTLAIADVIQFPESEREALVRTPYAVGDSRGTITLRTWLGGQIDVSRLLLGADPPQFALALSGPGLLRSQIKLVNFDGEAGPTEMSLSHYNDPEAPRDDRPWRIIDNRSTQQPRSDPSG